LHLFDETCNLINDQGDIVSLVSSSVGIGPFALLLPERVSSHVTVKMPVFFDYSKQTLSIGLLEIEVQDAAIWNPRPSWDNLRGLFITDITWPVLEPLAADLDTHLQDLLNGIAADDEALAYAGASELAGLGNGLTPAGDDILMGVLYGLWVWHPQQKWMDIILNAAIQRTTSLSAAFLRAAAAGEATIQWHNLANGDETAVKQILSIGHTSGRDAWTGFTRTGIMLMGLER